MSLTPTLDLIRNLSTESIAPSAPYIRDPELLAGIAKEKEAKTNALTEQLLAEDASYQAILKSLLDSQSELLMARAENARLAEADKELASRLTPAELSGRRSGNAVYQDLLREQQALDLVKAGRRTASEISAKEGAAEVLAMPTRDPIAEIISVESNKLPPELIIGGNKYQDLNALVLDTLRGKYGNGEARKKALGANYSKIQKEINERLGYRRSKKY